jgi:localization factor PodJL
MSDSAWVLKGIDPETRDRAVVEAQRLGVSLADYVTDMVLKTALHEQVGAMAADAEPAPVAEPSDFGVRHRFRTLERRLESSVGSLDSALSALDTALFDVTARVGEVEGLAGDTAHALRQALAEMAGQLAAVRLHITDVEENSVARDDDAAGAHASLSQAFTGLNFRTETIGERVNDVEIVARRADTNAAVLADAHEALKHAVADDFSSFAQNISDRLSHGLRDVAAAADEAAAQADAAVAHLVVELRGVRESLERSVAEGVDETRRRMHAAFTDAGERMEALSDRVDQVEMVSLRANEQLRIQLTDVEDAAQTALEETAESLRQAGAALAADLQRSTQDARAALESVHGDLASEISGLRERQQSGLARLKQVDAAAANTANELNALRETLLRRIADGETAASDLVARAQNELGEEIDTLTSRFARHERDTAETTFTLRAESERVETAVIASLEKLAQDIARGDATLHARLTDSASATNALVDELRHRVDAELNDVRNRQNGAAARLTVIDLALGAQTQIAERVAQIEAALGDTSTETSLAAIEARVSTLTKALAERSDEELAQRVEDLRARLAAYENHASVAADGVNDLVRMLGRVTTQNAEAAAKSEDRVHKLEMALADLKLDHLATREKPVATPGDLAALQQRLSALEERPVQAAATPDDIAALQWRVSAVEQRKSGIAPDDLAPIEQRMAAMEALQAAALETLRVDIVRFVTDNDRRLAALEHTEVDYNLAAEFDALRRRVEERILGIEQRSVRTLEQVADTVQMLEERFTDRDSDERQTA